MIPRQAGWTEAGGRRLWALRMATAPLRTLPTFLIVGAQKGGTTSLYQYLVRHPEIVGAYTKEVHYFDLNHHRGLAWYRAHFPVRDQLWPGSARPRRITGEATPYYLFHPCVPQRVVEVVPGVRVIAVLRDPVRRAFSHYNHERKLGREPLSFREATSRETERLKGEAERMITDPSYRSFAHQHYSYLVRGIYVDQVKRWLDWFPREQLLFLDSDTLFSDPAASVVAVLRFLGLSEQELGPFDVYNAHPYESGLDRQLAAELYRYFAASNRRLNQLLGTDYRWGGAAEPAARAGRTEAGR